MEMLVVMVVVNRERMAELKEEVCPKLAPHWLLDGGQGERGRRRRGESPGKSGGEIAAGIAGNFEDSADGAGLRLQQDQMLLGYVLALHPLHSSPSLPCHLCTLAV